ncbi:hypothetical protein JCM19238_1648 [Vibrio ponticus]|nr:hypothetical protein JCM19238_1648 [Vibrio ponticus]
MRITQLLGEQTLHRNGQATQKSDKLTQQYIPLCKIPHFLGQQ